jgi:general secretion pathway protein D
MDIVPIKYAIASDIATMINRLLEPPAGVGPDAGRVTLTADSRTNAVLIKAPSIARANLAKSLIAKLDQPTTLPGNVHVVYLKNADAIKLAQTLRAVVALDSSSNGSSLASQGAAASNPNTAAATAAGQSTLPPSSPASPATLSTGGPAGFIQADQATNTLIITASDTVYRNLRAVIDQLDARRAQVYIESLIVEVTAGKEAEFGVQWMALSGNANSAYRVGGATAFTQTSNNLFTLAAGNSGGTTPTLPGNGLSLGIFRQVAGQLTLGAIAHAVASDNTANILSMPNLITLDNEEAKIIVGQNVPFITGQFTTSASASATGVNPFQTVERKDIGLTLRVRPQISEGGTVKMAIYQESSSIDTSQNNAAGLITNKRSIETNVLVDDGQIIVLGGLVEDSVSDTEEKVNGLGDLPVVGNLFKYRTRSRTKTNLMVFLRPIVIRSEEQSANVTADRYNYMRNEQQTTQPQKAFLLPEMVAPVLPPDEKGQVGGGGLVKMVPSTRSSKQSAAPEAPVIDLTKPQ